jgi:hypothetical protein
MRWYSMVVIYLFNLAWFHVLFSIIKINMHLIWKCICYTIFASQGLRSAPLLSRSGEERIVTLGKQRWCYAYHMKNCRRPGISLSLSLKSHVNRITFKWVLVHEWETWYDHGKWTQYVTELKWKYNKNGTISVNVSRFNEKNNCQIKASVFI